MSPFSHRILVIALLGISASAAYISAADMLGLGHHCNCPHCQVVEEVVYQDVVSHTCKQVPDTKKTKKVIYECKEIPYCVHKLTCPLKHDTCCEKCTECECCARYKKVLVKREIVVKEECITKCVPEPFVTRVPVKVCRIIPCAKCAAAGCANAMPCTQAVPAQAPTPAGTTPIQIPSPPVDNTSYSISDLVAPVHVK